MEDRREWDRTLFESLTSRRVSRNKFFAQFATQWFQSVHRRFRVVSSLQKDAQRLGGIPDTQCWISGEGESLVFHLQSPRLSYVRSVALRPYEWEWLGRQKEIQSLLSQAPRNAVLEG